MTTKKFVSYEKVLSFCYNKTMKKIHALHLILRRTYAYWIFISFIFFIFLAALIFLLVEPDVTNYGQSLWFTFALFTIGFGKIIPETVAGQILTVILILFSLVVLAVLTAIIVFYYQEHVSKKYKVTHSEVLDKFKDLHNMSAEEIHELSAKIKELQNKPPKEE